MTGVWVVVPALDEAVTIRRVIESIPPQTADGVIVVDGGSSDDTGHEAAAAGAEVILEPRRGYGRACSTGVTRAAARGASVVAFLDGGLAEDPADLPAVIEPILAGRADLVIGSRVLGRREPGALAPAQRAGNALATWLIGKLYGHRYTDLGSMRAVRCAALERLAMTELGHGWPAQMQVRALRAGLRVCEVPIHYRRRAAGRSKVSGSLWGSARAGASILRVVIGNAR